MPLRMVLEATGGCQQSFEFPYPLSLLHTSIGGLESILGLVDYVPERNIGAEWASSNGCADGTDSSGADGRRHCV